MIRKNNNNKTDNKKIKIKPLKVYIFVIRSIKIRIVLISKQCFSILCTKLCHHNKDSASVCRGYVINILTI